MLLGDRSRTRFDAGWEIFMGDGGMPPPPKPEEAEEEEAASKKSTPGPLRALVENAAALRLIDGERGDV